MDDDERQRAIVNYDEGHIKKITRHYTRSIVTEVPSFEATDFEATILKLQATTTGDWVVTLKVPPNDDVSAMKLSKAYGLALQVNIIRKRFTTGAN